MKIKSPKSYRAGGFTLSELVIVVAIVAILFAVAYPSYIEQVIKGNRGSAQADLLNLAQYMQRYYTLNNQYTTGASPDAYPVLPFTESPGDGSDPRYALRIIGTGVGGAVTADEYILIADPNPDPADAPGFTPSAIQADNGVLHLNNYGRKYWDNNNDGDFTDANEDHW